MCAYAATLRRSTYVCGHMLWQPIDTAVFGPIVLLILSAALCALRWLVLCIAHMRNCVSGLA